MTREEKHFITIFGRKARNNMLENKLTVRVYPLEEPKGSTKAFASVTIDDLIAIRGIRVLEGEKGLFVAMPQTPDKKPGEYRDTAFLLKGDLRKSLNHDVINEYIRVIALPHDQRVYTNPEINKNNGKSTDDANIAIQIYLLDNANSKTKAFANISINDVVGIRGVRIVDGEKGLFVTMPQSKDKDNNYHDVAFPVSGDLRKKISQSVLQEFDKSKDRSKKVSLANKLAEGAAKSARAANDRPQASAKSQENMIA